MKQIYLCFLLGLLFHSIPSHSQKFIKESYVIEEFATLNDHTYFVANDPVHGSELWKTDGTEKGTVLVKDIFEGILSSDPQNLFAYKGHIFFTANDGIIGHELYKTDGTPEGTVLVKDIHPSLRQGSNATNFTVYNDLLYFSATNQYINGSHKIFSTDGTSEGTNLVYVGEENSYGNFTDLTVANQKLYFRSSMGNGLYELDASTQKVNSIHVDEYYTVDELNSFNNELYFITNTSYRQEIRFYRINKEGELIRLKEFAQSQYGDIDIANFTQVGKEVFFSMNIDNGSSEHSNELWKTNGSPEGTVIITTYDWDRHMYGSEISNFTSYNGKLFFAGGLEHYYTLMESDGTSEGTKPVSKDRYLPVDNDTRFVQANGLLYFSSGLTIWSTDGTDENTIQQTSLRLTRDSTAEVYYIKSDGEKIYFKARVEDENAISYNWKILYTTEASSLLEVEANGRKIEDGSQINFESKIDSIIRVRITVRNKGRESLILSKIQVTGKDFYLNGKGLNNTTPQDYFPQQIDSKENAVFDLIFYPSAEGFQNGILTIHSNDTKNPEFSIDLKSYTNESISTNNSGLISLRKEIQFEPGAISLSKGIFSENLPLDSTVGTLSIPFSSDTYEYSLVSGKGDDDNASFQIVDNLLKTAESFDATFKNTLIIRILAKNKSTGNVLEDAIILGIEAEPNEPSLKTCPLTIEKMIFGLQDVTYIGPNEVVAVGNEGVILKSYDGGQSWVKKYNKPNTGLFDLEFTDANIGYSIGSHILLKTEDGGENWYSLDMPDKSYPYVTNLLFIDPEVGFIIGYESELYKTTDGGKNWRIIKNIPNYVTSGYFINGSTGYMCGNSPNTIVKTTDAGETWETIQLNLPDSYDRRYVDLFFTDEQTGYLLSSDADIAKTTDGGATWNLLENDMYGMASSINFISGSTGYITSASGLHKTEDAGETWTNIFSNSTLEPKAVAFNGDGQQAVMVGPGVYGASNGIAYKTGTKDWEVISHFPTETYSITGFFEDAGFYFSEREARRTLDGGITWKEINKPDDYSFSQVQLVEGNLYLSGNENLYKSTDLGETWTSLGNIQSSSIMHFINNDVVIAGGNTIMRSVNGGKSWEPVFNEDYLHATDVSFINDLKGAVAGLGGIALTRNGGQTWEKISIPLEDDNAFMYSIHFFDSSIGLAGSNNGIIYKSTDEGKTWSKRYTTIIGEIRFLYAKSALEWYAVDTAGSNSYLYKSTDGGESWVRIGMFGSEMYQFYVVNDIIYISGRRASVYTVSIADDPPRPPGHLEGDRLVMGGTTTSYSVFQETGQNYSWEVSGDNDLFFEENTAKITWDKPGNYTLSVTPYSSCRSGTTRHIEVTVQEKEHSDPVISGDVEVKQYSKSNSYSVELRPNSKYEWFAEGAVALTSDKNEVSIDWGQHGKGKVQVVETNVNSGIRYSAILEVTITAVTDPKIKITDITCRGKDNGSIYIETGNESINFTANLYSGSEERNFEFNSQLNIENLGPGNYTLCLDRLTDNYRSCYEFEIKEPAQFEVKSERSAVSKNQLDLTISGGVKPYKVFLNGELIANTNQQQLSIQTIPGDHLEVFSSGDCAFSYEETITPLTNLTVYPNPTRGPFSIALSPLASSQNPITVRIYSPSGNLISSLKKEIKDNKVFLDISQEPTGIYFLKLGDSNTQTIKIMKQ